jgi:hypothetical protein
VRVGGSREDREVFSRAREEEAMSRFYRGGSAPAAGVRNVALAALLGVALALMSCALVLLAAPTSAQDTSVEETTATEATGAEATAGEATARTGEEGATATTGEGGATVKAGETAQAGETKAQGDEDAGEAAQPENSDQLKPFAEVETESGSRKASQSGPLAGTETVTFDRNGDERVDVIRIPGDCKAKEGASFVLEDDDGTQGTFIDNRNVQIEDSNEEFLKVTGKEPGKNIKARDPRGGDGILDSGGLTVITSTDITCAEEDTGGGGDAGDNDGDGGDGGDNNGGDNGDDTGDADTDNDGEPDATDNCDNVSNPDQADADGNGTGDACEETTPDGSGDAVEQEPQDEEEGPLAGGTARGYDVLVPEDLIRTLPDGTRVYGIDQIRIPAENCELTEQGDGLTVTLNDQGVPFRIRDGDNVDFVLRDDGTIIANGRETLGDTFPADSRDNPDRLIVPIPVDPENDDFSGAPNDTFPIISSTGIGGEGCRPAKEDSVNRSDTLPDTGGLPLAALLIGSLFLGAGVLVWRSLRAERG